MADEKETLVQQPVASTPPSEASSPTATTSRVRITEGSWDPADPIFSGGWMRTFVRASSASTKSSASSIDTEAGSEGDHDNFDALVSLLVTAADRGPLVQRAVLLAAFRAGEDPRAVYEAAASELVDGALPAFEQIEPPHQ